MKNILTIVLSLATIASCTKKNESVEAPQILDQDTVTSNNQDSKTQNNVVETTSIKEWSPEAVSQLVAAKNNDTLYVTNFFATWCGPCVREIPHFKAKMDQMQGQPVKFTFISLDQLDDWATTVPEFSKQHGIENNVILLNGENLGLEFFRNNFKTWTGGSIPFTLFSKNGTSEEYSGMMTEEALNDKLQQFK